MVNRVEGAVTNSDTVKGCRVNVDVSNALKDVIDLT